VTDKSAEKTAAKDGDKGRTFPNDSKSLLWKPTMRRDTGKSKMNANAVNHGQQKKREGDEMSGTKKKERVAKSAEEKSSVPNSQKACKK